MYKDASCELSRQTMWITLQKCPGHARNEARTSFIGELIKELEKSGQGVCMYGSNVSSSTFADDMTNWKQTIENFLC